MEEEIGELDVVEIIAASPFTPEADVGEQGTVVAIHDGPQRERAFEVESVLPNGRTKWQGAFTINQIKRVWKA